MKSMHVQLSHTQVILVQLNFFHYRRHHKGESLSVKVVQRVAHKHGQENSSSVVSITCSGHDCKVCPTKIVKSEGESRGGRKLLACDRPQLCVTLNFDSWSTVQKQLLASVCNQSVRLMVNFSMSWADLICVVTNRAVNDLFSLSGTQKWSLYWNSDTGDLAVCPSVDVMEGILGLMWLIIHRGESNSLLQQSMQGKVRGCVNGGDL